MYDEYSSTTFNRIFFLNHNLPDSLHVSSYFRGGGVDALLNM